MIRNLLFLPRRRTNRDCDKIKMDVDTYLEGKDIHYTGSVPTLTNSPTVKRYRRVAARILITAVIMLSILSEAVSLPISAT